MCETECFQLIFATGSDCLLLPFCQRWWFKFDHDSFNVTVHHSNLTIKIFWFGCIHWYLLCWILFGFSSFLYFFHFFYLFSDFFLLSNLFLFFLPFFFSENLFLPLALKIKLIYTKRYAEKELVCLQFISISFDD